LTLHRQPQSAEQGPNKSKRAGLRLIGLALLVSTEFNFPLFFQTYAGNQHDSSRSGASPRNWSPLMAP
jgi:transposase